MGKTVVIYESYADPTLPYVGRIAIQTETEPPHVWGVFSGNDGARYLGNSIVIMPKKAAFNLFEFRSGRIEDCRRIAK